MHDEKPGAFRGAILPIIALAALLALPFAAEAMGQQALVTLATRMMILGVAASALNALRQLLADWSGLHQEASPEAARTPEAARPPDPARPAASGAAEAGAGKRAG